MKRLTITSEGTKAKYLIYGKPGSGKTHFCASLGLDPRTAPVLHIDVAGNPITLEKALTKSAMIDVLQPERLTDLNDVYDWLAANQPLDKHLAKKFELDRQYNTVVFDGITGVQREAFTDAMALTNHRFADAFPRREFKHYGIVLQQMIHMAKLLYALDLHVIVTAQDHTQTRYAIPGDLSTAYEYHYPLLEGEGKTEFPGYALMVMRLIPAATDHGKAKQLGARYNYGCMEHNRYQYGKDQYGFGLTELADPTIGKLLDQLEKHAN